MKGAYIFIESVSKSLASNHSYVYQRWLFNVPWRAFCDQGTRDPLQPLIRCQNDWIRTYILSQKESVFAQFNLFVQFVYLIRALSSSKWSKNSENKWNALQNLNCLTVNLQFLLFLKLNLLCAQPCTVGRLLKRHKHVLIGTSIRKWSRNLNFLI